MKEVSLEWVQILVEELSVQGSLICELLLVLQCQVVRTGRGVRGKRVVEASVKLVVRVVS